MAIAKEIGIGLPERVTRGPRESAFSNIGRGIVHTWDRFQTARQIAALPKYTPENIEKAKKEAKKHGRFENAVVRTILFNSED